MLFTATCITLCCTSLSISNSWYFDYIWFNCDTFVHWHLKAYSIKSSVYLFCCSFECLDPLHQTKQCLWFFKRGARSTLVIVSWCVQNGWIADCRFLWLPQTLFPMRVFRFWYIYNTYYLGLIKMSSSLHPILISVLVRLWTGHI